MNKTLITSDWHVTDQSIPEVEEVLNEIYFDNPKIKDIKEIFILGDLFDKKRPTALEIKFITRMIKELMKKFSIINLIVGNHEEIKINELSLLDYLQYFSCKMQQINIYREYTINNIHFGHRMTDKSKHGFGNVLNADNLSEKYKMSFLGDEHSYSVINGNIIHPGSIRYVNFGEVKDKGKYYLLFDMEENFKEIQLKNCIPMYDVNSIEELEKLEEKTKVRLVVKSFDYFKKIINSIPKYNDKFHTFKIKPDFQIVDKKEIKVETKDFFKALDDYLNENKVNEEIKNILLENLKGQ